jgi:hypothetical protein
MNPDTIRPQRFWRTQLTCLAVCALGGCATGFRPLEPGLQPDEVRAKTVELIPATVADRQGWAADIYAALATLGLPHNAPNICATLAITEQESGYKVDPPVPNLGKIARAEIDRRAERAGIPAVAVRAALGLPSRDGKSFGERIEAAQTEKELSGIYEDFIGAVPLGTRLFAGWNPVRTGGPMQVSVAFAEQQAKDKPYPYPVEGSIRREVFTRRGGMYFGIAHLLDYPVAYDSYRYRFADFNAGRYASRNAAFQNAVSLLSGVKLALDGDLVRHDGVDGSTVLALRALGRQLELSDADIRRSLEDSDEGRFERSVLYRRVFEAADQRQGKPLPRAVVPDIALQSPKITRKLTTEWFASRVHERYRRCMAKAGGLPGANES